MSGTGPATPSENDVLALLQQIAVEDLDFSPAEAAAVQSATPIGSLPLDSLRQVVLLARLEDTYGVAFDGDERDALLAVRTVGDLVRAVRDRVGR